MKKNPKLNKFFSITPTSSGPINPEPSGDPNGYYTTMYSGASGQLYIADIHYTFAWRNKTTPQFGNVDIYFQYTSATQSNDSTFSGGG